MPLVIKVVSPNKKIRGALDTQEHGKNISSSIDHRNSHAALNKLRRPLDSTGDDKLTYTNKLRRSKAQRVETHFYNTNHKLSKGHKVNGREFHVIEVRSLKTEELWRLWADTANVKIYHGCNSKGTVPKKTCKPGARGQKPKWKIHSFFSPKHLAKRAVVSLNKKK